MDDDDSDGRGISGAAGFLLGRLSTQSEQSTRQVAELARRRHQSSDTYYYDPKDVESAIASWKAAVARLDSLIVQLKMQLSGTSIDNAALNRENQALREQVAKHEHDIALMQGGIENLVAFHEEKLNGLRAEVARLQGKS